MNRALRSLVFAAVLASLFAFAACPGPEPEGGADAQVAGGDASDPSGLDAGPLSGEDAASMLRSDVGLAGPDATTEGPDAGDSAGEDAAVAGEDAALPGEDAATAGPDAGGLPGSPAEAFVASEDDALASYLINASPAAWNIFSGASVPLGRHFDVDHVSYHTALRFPAVSVPQGATITSAKVSFYPTNSVDSSNNLWLNVYAEKAEDSAPFDPTNYDTDRPDQRLKTTAYIDHWLVRCNSSCTDLSEYDCPQRELDCWDPAVPFTCPKDLKAMVQEVVDQPGWVAGNAMTIFLVNSATDEDGVKYQNSRHIVGYDTALGTQYAPKLVVEFTP